MTDIINREYSLNFLLFFVLTKFINLRQKSLLACEVGCLSIQPHAEPQEAPSGLL